jgi:uroporphyrinogen decarboxylase
MDTLSPRENTDRILRRGRPERIGFHDSPWGDTLEQWLKEGYPRNDDGKPADPVNHFGFDLAGVGGWFDMMPIPEFSEIVAETDEWIARRNGAGGVLKYWKHKSGTPEHLDFRMASRDIWERDYRHHLLTVDRSRLDLEGARKGLAARREQGLWTYYGHLFLWETMRASLGDIGMFEAFLLDPEWIRDYNRVYTDFYKAHYRILLEEAGKPDGIWIYEDLGYCRGLFCSPKVLEDLIFPFYKEVVDFFHGYDLPVVLHTCGGIEEALPLIVQAGFDGLNPMQVKAGCDVVRFARRYGDRLAFIGGLDAMVLESGDRARIRREIERIIGGIKEAGARLVFGSDHSLSPNVRYADFQYAAQVYREWMAY